MQEKKNNYNKILNENNKQIKILNEFKINKKFVTSGFGFSTLEYGIYKKLVLVQKQIHLHKWLFLQFMTSHFLVPKRPRIRMQLIEIHNPRWVWSKVQSTFFCTSVLF